MVDPNSPLVIVRERIQQQTAVPIAIDPAEQRQAAVLIPIVNRPDPEVVLTRRAMHMNTHRGEVAFPGGKCDAEDQDLVATALREAHEEIGVPPSVVEVVGAMPQAKSKFGIPVTPVVGILPGDQRFEPNPDELDHIFSVPLSYLRENGPDQKYHGEFKGVKFTAPCYNYQGNIIWGLTAFFVVEFMRVVFDQQVKTPVRIV